MPKPIVSASASAGGSVKGKERASDEEDVEDVKEKKYTRDEHTLQIIEKLEMGPKEFGFDPEGEQVWEYVEPNSKIRLK
jgi:minichromosome maintenance protein 10